MCSPQRAGCESSSISSLGQRFQPRPGEREKVEILLHDVCRKARAAAVASFRLTARFPLTPLRRFAHPRGIKGGR